MEKLVWAAIALLVGLTSISCGSGGTAHAGAAGNQDSAGAAPIVAVTTIGRKPIGRSLTMSSELVPFQEIDVFAKESGYVSKLYVDYGSHVKRGQLLAVLEIPELQALLQEDQASIKSAGDQVANARHQLSRVEAQHNVLHLQYQRLNQVAQSKPGLVAEQEVDDAHGKDLAAEAQVEAAQSDLQNAQSQIVLAQAKLAHDQALFDYSRITAPFDGVVTQRYANLGTLMQAGTTSSTAMPLVKLSEESLYRLVIPVPESDAAFIQVGDPVDVNVPSADRHFPGKVARLSFDVNGVTRTMHSEVDVPNPQGTLLPGVYAEATLLLGRKSDALVVPLQAVNQGEGHAAAWIVDASGHAQPRSLTLGVQTENYAEVLSGLNPGDKVVIGDPGGLRPGEPVRSRESEVSAYKSDS